MAVFLLRNASTPDDIWFAAKDTRVSSDPSSDHANSTGTLYICEHQLVFSDEAGRGFSLRYQSIVIHAVSRDPEDAPHLYCQLDCRFPGTAHQQNNNEDEPVGSDDNDDESEEDEEELFSELRFYPKDESELDGLFKALCDCAALNPDAEDDSDSNGACDDGNDGAAIQQLDSFDPSAFITSVEQLDRLTPRGKEVLAHLESVLETSAEAAHGDRFADAEGDEGL